MGIVLVAFFVYSALGATANECPYAGTPRTILPEGMPALVHAVTADTAEPSRAAGGAQVSFRGEDGPAPADGDDVIS